MTIYYSRNAGHVNLIPYSRLVHYKADEYGQERMINEFLPVTSKDIKYTYMLETAQLVT